MNRRLAIASLLSSDSSTPTLAASAPPKGLDTPPHYALEPPRSRAPQHPPPTRPHQLSPTIRHASPPLQFSLPTALTRRTPSPTSLDDAPPMKRHRSDPETDLRRARQQPQYQRQYSPVAATNPKHPPPGRAARAAKPSYSNPSFYATSGAGSPVATSPRSPVAPPHRPIHSVSTGDVLHGTAWQRLDRDELDPLPIATFTQTTHTEQRWEESRSQSSASASGSGGRSPVAVKAELRRPTHSPTIPTHVTALAALSASSRAGEDAPLSAVEDRSQPPSRGHHSPPQWGASDRSRGWPSPSSSRSGPTSAAPKQHSPEHSRPSISAIHHFPSSSERDMPPSPRRSPSSAYSVHSTAPIHPTSPVSERGSVTRPDLSPMQRSDSRDAHEWLLHQFAETQPSRRPPRASDMHSPDETAVEAPRDEPTAAPYAVESSVSAPDSPTVEDELLRLIDGPEEVAPDKQSSRDREKAAKADVGGDAAAKQCGPTRTKETVSDNSALKRQLSPSATSTHDPIPKHSPGSARDRPASSSVPVNTHAGSIVHDEAAGAPLLSSQAKLKPVKKSRVPSAKKKADNVGAPARVRKKPPAPPGRSRSASVQGLPPSGSRPSSPVPMHSLGTGVGGSSPAPVAQDDMDLDVEIVRTGSARPHEESDRAQRRDRARGMDDEDKLYCVCKTPYDEDRVMIACDRCDEWYHTACVDLLERDLDLIDQFTCPVCAEGTSLKTTYKMRCHFGATSSRASSPSACSKPARPPLSKYCSDECGMQHVALRLQSWETKGGSKEELWNLVKTARKVEGVTVEAPGWRANGAPRANGARLVGATELELKRLRALLDQIMQDRAELLRALDFVRARERLVELSAARSDKAGECGWDERLLLGDADWQVWIGRIGVHGGAWLLGDAEEPATAEKSHWWCTGKRKCDRHSGWQKLRLAEVEVDRLIKNQILEKLTTRERDVRRCIEDLEPPTLLADAGKSTSRPRFNGRGTRGGGPKRI